MNTKGPGWKEISSVDEESIAAERALLDVGEIIATLVRTDRDREQTKLSRAELTRLLSGTRHVKVTELARILHRLGKTLVINYKTFEPGG